MARHFLRGLPAAAALLLSSCAWDGHFTLLGYTTRPNYDTSIHTIHVPIFKNTTFRRGLEFELTRAVIREIEAKTPYKVVAEGCPADTELTGTIVGYTKTVITRNQLNEVREAETLMTVEVIWRDLRTGEVISRPRPNNPWPPVPQLSPPPASAPPGQPQPPPRPMLVTSTGRLIPEWGESLASAEKMNVDRLAVQIVSMMETPW